MVKQYSHAYRDMDPARGAFDPITSEPLMIRDPEASNYNPRGVRHIDKTRQDHMPVDKRPRVAAWQKRKDAMS